MKVKVEDLHDYLSIDRAVYRAGGDNEWIQVRLRIQYPDPDLMIYDKRRLISRYWNLLISFDFEMFYFVEKAYFLDSQKEQAKLLMMLRDYWQTNLPYDEMLQRIKIHLINMPLGNDAVSD